MTLKSRGFGVAAEILEEVRFGDPLMNTEIVPSRPLFRRGFLQRLFGGLAATGIGAAAAERQQDPYATPAKRVEGKPPEFKTKLRITKLETILVKPRWLFLKVHTDEGVVGLGEPITEGRAKTCAAAVAEVEPY